HHAHRRQFPSVEYETSVKTLESISYGSGMRLARLAPPQVWAELPLKRCHAQAVRAAMRQLGVGLGTVVISWILVNAHRKYLPAERGGEHRRGDDTGNWRLARMESIMSPTSPLAPTIPTCTP